MESNFAFLDQDMDAQILKENAENSEKAYLNRDYSSVFTNIRVIYEHVIKQVIDCSYKKYDFERATFAENLKYAKREKLISPELFSKMFIMKQGGNKAAHELSSQIYYTKDQALAGLQNEFDVLNWFVGDVLGVDYEPGTFLEPQVDENQYPTSEQRLIYAQSVTAGIPLYAGSEKVGETSFNNYDIDMSMNSKDLREIARHRIDQYMKTAGLPYQIDWVQTAYIPKQRRWFEDHDVHDVLIRSGIKRNKQLNGREWFKTDVETVKKAIAAVKEGQRSINVTTEEAEEPQSKIDLRPEQKEAVKKTKKAFKKYDKMLWNAKMRFGKTLSALQLVKEKGYQHVLIMTHRPVVDEGWYEDFRKLGMPKEGYRYGSRQAGESFSNLINGEAPFVYFASLQDLRGSEMAGGKAGDKNEELFNTTWDLVIIDEAHEGTQTQLAQNVTNLVVTPNHTKLLELSGTPFNILDQYEEDQVYTWDYVMEQRAKLAWTTDYPDEPNPYDGLPKVSMYTFEMNRVFEGSNFIDELTKSFNFKEFFRVDDRGEFVYKDKVKQFLDNITSPNKATNYPFSTPEFRNRLRHTLWILPGVKEAGALEKMLENHPVFGMDYKIVNVVKDLKNDDNGVASESDVQRVNDAIGKDASATKTITLTVRKLTTGVTIKPWTGVVFLSNTNSAMQYLQAAFRAQTPYCSETFGKKTNCYIFDFAPDRALKVMAESSRLSSGVGKRVSKTQKDKMRELLNFLPIIGEEGHGMKPFKVDSLLTKIKKIYAEKAVQTGFDDDSLYSDELLMLDKEAIDEFNKLKAIVGRTKQEKKKETVDVNKQGLTDEEYDQATKGEKKPKKDRTPAELAAIEKMKALKKQRKNMISILRSISIRIPLMIFGMDVDLDEDVNMRKFARLVDDKSWKEFMPSGVTKELFNKFTRYYDEQVFIEAGKIIRRRVKQLDKMDPLERTEQLATIFGTFRNPDKETVLTPWRVVNLQLGKTIGGLSFFDDKYQDTTVDGVSANHWIDTEYTKQVFKRDTKILEINSKTGLYPLYAAMSLYWQDYQKLIEETAGKFSAEDELMIWQRVLRENIFVVAKTPMSAQITKRTLIGYRQEMAEDLNIQFVDNIVPDTKKSVKDEAEKIKELFNLMKFDVVIGNPPYQIEANGDSTRDEPIYHNFMDLAFELSDVVTLITPARFLSNAGQTPKWWNKKVLSDPHLKVILFEDDSSRIFPKTQIKGGVTITLRDANKNLGPIGLFTPYEKLNSVIKKVHPSKLEDQFTSIVSSQGLTKFSKKALEIFPEIKDQTGKGTGRKVTSRLASQLHDIFLDSNPKPDSNEFLKIYGLVDKKREVKYIDRKLIDDNLYTDKYKVLVCKANGNGKYGETLADPFVAAPYEVPTDTFICIGPFESEYEANAALKYIYSKFLRALLGARKVTQDNPKNVWCEIPLLGFDSESDINWNEPIRDIDSQLYQKYGLNKDEIDFIENNIQTMDE